MGLLARREHSRLELRQKLQHKAFDDEIIEQALVLLGVQNYQSDERFSGEFVQMRFNQGKGSVRILADLKQRGIADFDLSAFDFYALAKRVRVQKYGELLPKNYVEKAKQQRFLQSRGFDFEAINRAFVED